VKLEFFHSEGGSILPHGQTTSPEPSRHGNPTAEASQRNRQVDIAEIEARARALRAAAIADLASRLWKRLCRRR